MDAAVTDEELQIALQAKRGLMALVRPELELLSSQIAGTNFLCAFADETGVVLDAITDSEFDASECARSVRVGSIWREDIRGTNALGLALSTRQTSMVTGQEHFFACHGGVSCVSTPIFASDGSIVGLLDASSEVEERQFHTRALVKLAATNIENRLFVEAHQAEYIIQFHPRQEYLPTQSVGLIAVDAAGRITGANRNSSRLLPGLSFATAREFGDLFRGDFQVILRRLSAGETVQLSEWLNSGFFARLHPASSHRTERTRVPGASLHPPVAYRMSPQERELALDDEMARDCLRIAVRAVKLGQPVCIRGATGTGKTALASAVHRRAYAASPLIAIDCRRLARGAEGAAEADGLLRHIAAVASPLAGGGTLVLEHVSALNEHDSGQLEPLIDSLREAMTSGLACILATENAAPGESGSRIVAQIGLKMLAVDLPALELRTDFEKVARSMLADLSPEHRLSTKALRALSGLERRDNLNDLDHQLRVLAASSPAGVIRDTHVAQVFPQKVGKIQACSRCEGVPIRRQRCIEIRQTFQACKGNVALTARRLGVSRNTVYAHLKG